MGMFDNLTVKDFNLPIPEDVGELTDVDWNDVGYQTKDLDNAMWHYEIREGALYVEECEYEDIPKEEREDTQFAPFMRLVNKEWKRTDHTGYVKFYEWFNRDKNDYWVEFTAHIANGSLQKIDLTRWDVEDNTERLVNEAKWKLEMREREEYRKKWRYRFFGQYWNRFITWNFRLERRIHSWCIDFSWKAERWLTF